MSWTYSGDPSSCPKDEVRYLVGDTKEDDPLLSDEEILYTIKKSNDVIVTAALKCCDAILAALAREIESSVGPIEVLNQQKFEHYQQLKRIIKEGAFIAAPLTGAPTTPGTFSVGMNDFI